MNTYALFGKDGRTVANIIIATQQVADANYPTAIRIDHLQPTPGINWTYSHVTKTFTAPGN